MNIRFIRKKVVKRRKKSVFCTFREWLLIKIWHDFFDKKQQQIGR